MRLMYCSILVCFFCLFSNNNSEAQILKKIKKGIDKLKKVEEEVPKKIVEEPQEKQPHNESSKLDLPEGYEWFNVDFDNDMMIDFELVVLNGRLVNYNLGNSSLDRFQMSTKNWELLEALNKYILTRKNKGSYVNLLPLINIEAREKYFCNSEIKGKHTSINRNWCSPELGGPRADEFAKRRAEKEFNESGIQQAAIEWANKLPNDYINIVGVRLPEYSFEQEAFVFEFNDERNNKYKFYWKLSPEEGEKIHDQYSKGLYRVIEPDSSDWTQNRWAYYSDISLKNKVIEHKTSDMFEFRPYMKAGAPHVYKEMAIPPVHYDSRNINLINGWFLDFCENVDDINKGFVNCDLMTSGLVDFLKKKQLFPSANSIRAMYQEPYFEKAIAQKKLIEIDDNGKPELEGYHAKRVQYGGNESFRGTYEPEKLIADLKEGRSTELFVNKGAFTNYLNAQKKKPNMRDKSALEKYFNQYKKPRLKSSLYRRYQDINGTKSEEEFMSCFLNQSLEIAMSYVGELNEKSIEVEVVRNAINLCK